MIPKQLFFIWIGFEKPNYVDYSIKKFKEMNPDFSIELIYEKDIYNTTNKDIVEFRELLKDNNSIYYKYKDNYTKGRNEHMSLVRQISDTMKLFLINKYGGIYLDCDTFPVRPFDDKLLSKFFFVPNVISITSKTKNADFFVYKKPILNFNEVVDMSDIRADEYQDVYFIGGQKNLFNNVTNVYDIVRDKKYRIETWIRNIEETERYKILSDMFFKNKLSIDFFTKNEIKEHYIYHFRQFSFK